MSVPRDLQAGYAALSAPQRRLLLERALLAPADLAGHQPSLEDTFIWVLRPPDGLVPAEATIYLDGSLLDGPGDLLGRNGWAFSAFDCTGDVIAEAHGVPLQ